MIPAAPPDRRAALSDDARPSQTGALIPQPTEAGRYVSIGEAVALTGRSKDSFHRAIKAGAIPFRLAENVRGRRYLVWLTEDAVAGDDDAAALRRGRALEPRRAESVAAAQQLALALEQMTGLARDLAAASERAGRAEALHDAADLRATRAESERDALRRDRDVVVAERDRALAELARRDDAPPWWRRLVDALR